MQGQREREISRAQVDGTARQRVGALESVGRFAILDEGGADEKRGNAPSDDGFDYVDENGSTSEGVREVGGEEREETIDEEKHPPHVHGECGKVINSP